MKDVKELTVLVLVLFVTILAVASITNDSRNFRDGLKTHLLSK